VPSSADGIRTTIPAKMIREMPFPIPFSEICSPIHMMREVPAVSVNMVKRRKPHPGCGTSAVPFGSFMLSSPMAMKSDWKAERAIVPYRVYWVIFFRPASPSLARRSRAGTTTVRSWRMIDAEMYGMMPRAKMVKLRRLPPEKRSTRPSSVFCTLSKNLASAALSTPGVGTWAPTR